MERENSMRQVQRPSKSSWSKHLGCRWRDDLWEGWAALSKLLEIPRRSLSTVIDVVGLDEAKLESQSRSPGRLDLFATPIR